MAVGRMGWRLGRIGQPLSGEREVTRTFSAPGAPEGEGEGEGERAEERER